MGWFRADIIHVWAGTGTANRLATSLHGSVKSQFLPSHAQLYPSGHSDSLSKHINCEENILYL